MIDYSNRPSGMSRREYEAQQTGGSLNYDTGEISRPNIYSGENVFKAVTNPVAKPDYSQYNIESLNSNLQNSLASLNKLENRRAESQAFIEGQTGLGLIPMGRDEAEASRRFGMAQTGIANQIDAQTNALNAAKDAYATALGQYNEDRNYSLKEKELNASLAKMNTELKPGQNASIMAVNEAQKAVGNDWGAMANWLAQNGYDVSSGGEIDNELRRRNGLEPIKGSGLTSYQQINAVNSIAGQFDNEPIVKEYNTLQQQKYFINSLDNQTSNPADDQAIIYAFAKVMDPNSVVREGEYNTVQEYSQALLQRYGFTAKRAFDNSGFLTSEARKFLKETLNGRISANEKAYQNVYNEYSRRINNLSGENGEKYLTNYGQAFQQKPEETPNTIIRRNGKLYKVLPDGNYEELS